MTLLVNNHSYNPMYESQKLHKWDREWAWGMKDLVGQRIGVLGYGAIGRQGKLYLQLGDDHVCLWITSPTRGIYGLLGTSTS
jgi:phosphoglycerate dehydrogenase-like enzyme